jgi:hypothetical protein
MSINECIAIILRCNAPQDTRRTRPNRLSSGFMTPAWRRRRLPLQSVALSWRHSARHRPLRRQIVTNRDTLRASLPSVRIAASTRGTTQWNGVRFQRCAQPVFLHAMRPQRWRFFFHAECSIELHPGSETAMPARLDVRAGLPLRSTRFRASRRTASFAFSRPERRIPF